MTEEEFISFIKQNQRQFYLMAYHYAKNEQLALDIVQESVCRGFKNYRNVRQPEYMKTWFFRIVIHTSIDMCRKEKRLVPHEAALENLEAAQEIRSFEHEELYEAVNHLDLESRTIIMLRFFEDMKLEEIARVTDMKVSTVKSKLYRALKTLRKNLMGGESYGF